jgi:glucose/arabinose dehydrogenase
MNGQRFARSALVLSVLAALLAACGSSPRSQPVPLSALSELVEVRLVAALETPTAFAIRPGDPPEMVYVASQNGAVSRVNVDSGDSREILSLRDQTEASGERGLLGLAFSIDGSEMYVHFTDRNGDTNVNAIEMLEGEPDLTTMRTLLFVEQPYSNHNGGQLVVDDAGNLLVGLGDGGASGDPLGHGQNPKSLLGKILRIDPNPAGSATPYGIPADNPFAQSTTVAPEILFLGLRNPWSFSIDRATGDFWIADVGQNSKEELNRASSSDLGANFGWNVKEGTAPFKGSTTAALTEPIHDWDNLGGSSAIGGFVYRGSAIKDLAGLYLFADLAESGIFVLNPATTETQRLDLPISAIVGFGESSTGEIFILSHSSGLFALQPSPQGA